MCLIAYYPLFTSKLAFVLMACCMLLYIDFANTKKQQHTSVWEHPQWSSLLSTFLWHSAIKCGCLTELGTLHEICDRSISCCYH